MRAPLSWLREWVALPEDLSGAALGEILVRAGLEVERVEQPGHEITGPLVVGRILRFVDEPQKNGKTIRWVQVDVGPEHNQPHPDFTDGCREVVCGAHNFEVGDLVVVSLPGTTLAGGFEIASRKTYGHVSDGMICAEDELGIGHDHTGIIVLPADAGLAPGNDPADVLHLRDEVLDIEVSPDMAYCMSIRGLAREAGQSLGVAFTDVVDKATPASRADGYPVVLDDPACPLFVALTVTGVDATRRTPSWLQRRLTRAGMRSISLPVDISNYVMLETGQPLHAYDADTLRGPIRVRRAQPGETLVTLDDVERRLDATDLLITDDSGPIGLAGVMGGASTEVRDTTSTIVIEAASFDAATISRSMRRHGLPSEASKRFERRVDPNAAYSAAHLAARLLVELAGGTLSADETVAGAIGEVPTQVIDVSLPTRVLGVEVAPERVVEILRASGVAVDQQGETLSLTPPTWRPDLRDPFDYVEEVGRKVGFDQIPSVVPSAPVGRGLTSAQRARRAITAAVTGAGFVEGLLFPFASAEDLERLGIPADNPRRRLVRLANPLADTAPYLRTTLLPGLFAAVQRNVSRGNDDIALFESGSVFRATDAGPAPLPAVDRRPSDADLAAIEAALPEQPRHLAAVVAGAWRPAGWQGPAEPAGWQQVFAFADIVGGALGLVIDRTADDYAPFHPGRCAKLTVAGRLVGHAGEVHPSVCAAFGMPARTAAVELSLDALIEAAPGPGTIAPVSPHPVAKEDVALIVDEAVPAEGVRQALVEGAGELLESVHLFDVYRGTPVPPGRKSLAFALRFRAPDRTLKDADAASARDAAVAVAADRFGAELRAS